MKWIEYIVNICCKIQHMSNRFDVWNRIKKKHSRVWTQFRPLFWYHVFKIIALLNLIIGPRVELNLNIFSYQRFRATDKPSEVEDWFKTDWISAGALKNYFHRTNNSLWTGFSPFQHDIFKNQNLFLIYFFLFSYSTENNKVNYVCVCVYKNKNNKKKNSEDKHDQVSVHTILLWVPKTRSIITFFLQWKQHRK